MSPQRLEERGASLGADNDAAARLRMLIARLSRRLARTKAGAALTTTETTVLATIVRRGPIRLGDLAAFEAMNPTMLSRIVRHLEQSALIERHLDPNDRRAATVAVTDTGQRLHRAIRDERSDALSRLLSGLDRSERAALQAALPVLEHLAEQLKDAEP